MGILFLGCIMDWGCVFLFRIGFGFSEIELKSACGCIMFFRAYGNMRPGYVLLRYLGLISVYWCLNQFMGVFIFLDYFIGDI